MKIGIITFHHVDNYGATLQAYALWNFLKNQGYNVEIIDYRPYKAIKYYTRGLSPINKNFSINNKAFSNILRAWRMRKFLLNNVKLSNQKFYTQEDLQKFCAKYNYDVVITGSDQVWCIDSFRGLDTAYFLDFCSQNTKKISYAASCGHITSLGTNRQVISRLVQEFEAILVRDENSLNLINNECNRQGFKVLDPTFLIKYNEIINSPKLKDKYLLIYNQAGLEADEEDFVRKIAESQNLTIVSVGKYNKLAKINIESASPKEWIGLYSQASYIITNTYHGTIFSILFQKDFTVFVPGKKLNKVTDLLKGLGLENRIFSNTTKEMLQRGDIFNINYQLVVKILDLKILESKKYLLKAIEEEVTSKNETEH
jgi:polysaccharide pyruvyl transferase WcaK-like protein